MSRMSFCVTNKRMHEIDTALRLNTLASLTRSYETSKPLIRIEYAKILFEINDQP